MHTYIHKYIHAYMHTFAVPVNTTRPREGLEGAGAEEWVERPCMGQRLRGKGHEEQEQE